MNTMVDRTMRELPRRSERQVWLERLTNLLETDSLANIERLTALWRHSGVSRNSSSPKIQQLVVALERPGLTYCRDPLQDPELHQLLGHLSGSTLKRDILLEFLSKGTIATAREGLDYQAFENFALVILYLQYFLFPPSPALEEAVSKIRNKVIQNLEVLSKNGSRLPGSWYTSEFLVTTKRLAEKFAFQQDAQQTRGLSYIYELWVFWLRRININEHGELGESILRTMADTIAICDGPEMSPILLSVATAMSVSLGKFSDDFDEFATDGLMQCMEKSKLVLNAEHSDALFASLAQYMKTVQSKKYLADVSNGFFSLASTFVVKPQERLQFFIKVFRLYQFVCTSRIKNFQKTKSTEASKKTAFQTGISDEASKIQALLESSTQALDSDDTTLKYTGFMALTGLIKGYQLSAYNLSLNKEIDRQLVVGLKHMTPENPIFCDVAILQHRTNHPIYTEIGRISVVLANLLCYTDKPTIQESIERVRSFAINLYTQMDRCSVEFLVYENNQFKELEPLLGDVFKNTVFSVTLIYKTLLERIINDDRPISFAICGDMVESLSRLHYMVTRLGGRGFASYETVTKNLMEKLRNDRQVANRVVKHVLPIRYHDEDMFEASHSIVLSIFENRKQVAGELSAYYSSLILQQYPKYLNIDQLREAYTVMMLGLSQSDDAVAWSCLTKLIQEIEGFSEACGQNQSDQINDGENTAQNAALYLARGHLLLTLFDQIKSVNLVLLESLLKTIKHLLITEPKSPGRDAICKALYDNVSSGLDYTKKDSTIKWYLKLMQDLGEDVRP
ncbi:hypothetical protein K493DRAFT_308289 [Basidiobolus meristosporus CBS 931.73]|uniref:Uncharacterized protein n=1 Tax=Basidiobolus meristosporus CBS 931.73 TaxID=1314790 RepID=A0A1Y1X461_9FUNG|nr:hypothetical protein K493DRAFT_308289 [Basidiobolus meristosporus CBS 931.73]|eukprot:ORX80600.1 hypothetical protein K493DRAFT_308289 [Basidiobolus meristosporus CBS 931.73]